MSKSWHKPCAKVFFKAEATRDRFLGLDPADLHVGITLIKAHTDAQGTCNPLAAFLAWEKGTELTHQELCR